MGTHSNDVCGRFSQVQIYHSVWAGSVQYQFKNPLISRLWRGFLFSVDFIIPSIHPLTSMLLSLYEKPGLHGRPSSMESNETDWYSIRTFLGIMFQLKSDAQADRDRMLARLLLFSVRACRALRKANRRPSSISCKETSNLAFIWPRMKALQ